MSAHAAPQTQHPQTLDELVTEVATSLMAVSISSLIEKCDLVLQRIVAHFDVDLSFIRRNDHQIGATILLAEWPPRPEIPDPDPLGVVFFAGADRVFAAIEDLAEVLVARPDAVDADYQDRVHDGSGIMGVSSVTVPMRRSGVTTGVLGLIRFGDRVWTPPEINSLTALAALLAQTLSRVGAEEQLRYLAYHDELTGLYNRRALLDHLEARLADGLGPVAILFLDLDRLKAMNDLLGHAAGDEFLQNVSRRLQVAVGGTDFLARLGGDELVVVLGEPTAVDAAVQTGRNLQTVVTAPVRLGEEDVSRTVSIGVTVSDPGHCTVSNLLAQADSAVIAAKVQGGNGIVAFTEQMRVDNDERTDIELHLRHAITHDELVLHFQPQVDLVSGELLGAEALVRWNHPTRGLLPPHSFVSVAEVTNLSGELGRWVLNAACAQLRAWQAEFGLPNFSMGVNVSPAQLITVDLVADVARAVERNSVQASNLVLEITETAVVADLHRARDTLDALRHLGAHLAIDDFGTGYSSFAQLKTLPVETLKIDRGFVTNLAANRNDRAIVRSIIGLAESFGLRTMAEGVETPAAVTALINLGCHQAQGYLISRPVPADQMRRFILAHRIDVRSAAVVA
jgi:diguanylate cyclase (GGDEF)-like protein